MGEIDLRIRENGKIEIEDGCKIEKRLSFSFSQRW